MGDFRYIIRCQSCGHIMEVNSIDDLICSDCKYDRFDILQDFSDLDISDLSEGHFNGCARFI